MQGAVVGLRIGLSCVIAIVATMPAVATAQSIAFRGEFPAPAPVSIKVVVRFGNQAISCLHRPAAAQPAVLCDARIPPDYKSARVEIAAEGYEPWTKNVFLDDAVVELGQIALQASKPKDLAVTATRLRIKASRDFFIETVAENLSTRSVPVRSLTIEGVHSWNIQCRDTAAPNPWQPLTLDWQMARNPAASSVSGWTSVRGDEIQVKVRFRAANCGDYHHRLEATVPLDVTIAPGGVERIVLRVSELQAAAGSSLPIPSLADWESVMITIHATIAGTPVAARTPVSPE